MHICLILSVVIVLVFGFVRSTLKDSGNEFFDEEQLNRWYQDHLENHPMSRYIEDNYPRMK